MPLSSRGTDGVVNLNSAAYYAHSFVHCERSQGSECLCTGSGVHHGILGPVRSIEMRTRVSRSLSRGPGCGCVFLIAVAVFMTRLDDRIQRTASPRLRLRNSTRKQFVMRDYATQLTGCELLQGGGAILETGIPRRAKKVGAQQRGRRLTHGRTPVQHPLEHLYERPRWTDWLAL